MILPPKIKCFSPEESPSQCPSSSDNDLFDIDDSPWNEENTAKDKVLSILIDMGYLIEEVSEAVERCGYQAEITELTDYISAARIAKELDAQVQEQEPLGDDENYIHPRLKPRNDGEYSHCKRKRELLYEHKVDDDSRVTIPNPMIGFGVPKPRHVLRELSELQRGPPYFYYENVAFTPKGTWNTISRFLYDIKPEFVESKYFCAAARKRGYVHNLPIQDRFPLLPRPPLTIHEAFPLTKEWWAPWDPRTKLSCLVTVAANPKLTDKIREALESCHGETPPAEVKKYVLEESRKWNLIWVGKNRVAALDPDEIEELVGFPKYHTRGGGTDRCKALGNSFQVDTVAYHLSVLKKEFPNGMNVLSLFSGIGGAEVALHRLGILLKNVVSVESSTTSRNILQSWWEQTDQRGTLIEFEDIQRVSRIQVAKWIQQFGGFDLVIGGSPCNNLSGGNRVSRDGLQGKQSSLFHHYWRVLWDVKELQTTIT